MIFFVNNDIIYYCIMKSLSEFFSSLLNITMFCKEDSNDDLSKTNHEKEDDKKEDDKKEDDKKEDDKKEDDKKEGETFEFIEINENTITQDDIEDLFVTKF